MIVKSHIDSSNLCRIYFCISTQELTEREFPDDNPLLKEKFLEKYNRADIEAIITTNYLAKKKNKALSLKKLNFFTSGVKTDYYIGVMTAYLIPDDVKIAIPTTISQEVADKLLYVSKSMKSNFQKKLIECGLCYNKKVDVVSDYSTITYDLHYQKDDIVINTIKDQTFDMSNDEDINREIFLKAHVGDKIVVDEDEIVVVAEITKIRDKIPYSDERYNGDKLLEYGYSDFDEMYQDFKKSYTNLSKVNIVFDYILSYARENTEFSFPSPIKRFYKNALKNNYPSVFYGELNNDELEEKMFFDLLNSLTPYERLKIITDLLDFDAMFNDLEFYYRTSLIEFEEVSKYITKKNIISYYINNNIFKGIKL